MACKNRGVYGFLGPAWVLITMALRNTVVGHTEHTNQGSS